MAAQQTVQTERKVVVVDDNRMYREAMVRNLGLAGYTVLEAADGVETMKLVAEHAPQVVITDLDMRTRTEGLDVIRQLKAAYPHISVIMISAVGTFDEGAQAQQLGAVQVLSKSRIDQEIKVLYETLDQVYDALAQLACLRDEVDALGDAPAPPSLREALGSLLTRGGVDSGIKSSAFEILARLDRPTPGEGGDRFAPEQLEQAHARLRERIPGLDKLHPETVAMLRMAEALFCRPQDGSTLSLDRNMGFSYSFAVENEVKQSLGRKITRFIAAPETGKLLNQVYDASINSLELGFNQYVIRQTNHLGPEMNSDITKQVIERMRQHGSRYKPDGLKALGVIIFCFGRAYEFRGLRGVSRIANPLGLRGLEDADAVAFAYDLIQLQHLRNPYIHPEFTEREKIDRIRETAVNCLMRIGNVA